MIVVGDVDTRVFGAVKGHTEPAPIVQRFSTPFRISAKTPDTSRPSERVIVFGQAVDIMSEAVGTTDILEEVASNPLQATFKGSSFVLSAGFLTWALRGASLIASVAASLPAWQGFDPLPVLAAKKRDKKDEDDGDDKNDADWQEERVRRLFNPMDSTGDD